MKHRFILKGMSPSQVPPDLLPAIATFARVAHHASFTRAAAELGVSPSALSQTVRTLEARLGVRLLDRSTRKVGLTEIGRRFVDEARSGLASIANAVTGIDEARERPAGLLRLNLSRTAHDALIAPHLAAFLERYPDITLELFCDNNFLDMVAGGFDAGIRLGESLAQDVVAVPLGGKHRLVTVAAPRYLRGRTPPLTPADLAQHRCLNIRFSGSGAIYRWEYLGEDGAPMEVETNGPLISNDGDAVLAAARDGAGIACAFEAIVRADLDAGRLLPLLEPWWPSFEGFHLYHPSRSLMPRKLRVFIDFFRERNAPGARSVART